jgi:multidrug efflux pump subunit AcrA (membrane-fusion protein)
MSIKSKGDHMKKKTFIEIFIVVLLATFISGCSNGSVIEQRTIAPVQSGDLEVKVSSDGSIEMPGAVNLFFDTTMFGAPYSARIKEIYVNKGDMVKAGAVLAKLDDTAQKLAVESAQYALELAINNVVQTSCCGTARSPSFYSDSVALMRYEFAITQMEKANKYISDGMYQDAAEQVSLTKLDIEGAKAFYLNPEYRNLRVEFNDLGKTITSSQDLDDAIQRFTDEINTINDIQEQIKQGQYNSIHDSIGDLLIKMGDTHTVVKRITHLRQENTYPDTCTSYTVLNEILGSLDELNQLAHQENYDAVKVAEKVNLIRHDLELSDKILEENISTDRLGLNLKTLRDYNINIQSAIINLERTKQALLRTELIAPFDGKVVDINLQGGDMITQRYSTTGVPIDSYIIRLANTSSVKMTGVVDEIDVMKVAKGQKATILLDALPGQQLTGEVTFVSPYGPQQTAGIQAYGTLQSTFSTYEIEIALDSSESANLAGGLTATAEILIDKHTNVLTVPNSSLSLKDGEYSVNVMTDEKVNLIEQRPVKIGLQGKERTEIVSGLKEGEKVLLEKSAMPSKQLHK